MERGHSVRPVNLSPSFVEQKLIAPGRALPFNLRFGFQQQKQPLSRAAQPTIRLRFPRAVAQ